MERKFIKKDNQEQTKEEIRFLIEMVKLVALFTLTVSSATIAYVLKPEHLEFFFWLGLVVSVILLSAIRRLILRIIHLIKTIDDEK